MASQLSSLSPSMNRALAQSLASVDRLNWVFLGPPGVGKGTYASRLATALGVPHIAAGDLVRAEIKSASNLGKEMSKIVNKGQLLPDDIITQLLLARVESGALETAEQGFILDGFPRTRKQAEDLQAALPVHLAVNLSLREDILVEKCLGRRICGKCGKNWNVADIYVPASDSHPEIVMPPLMPPAECLLRMETRADDREEVIRQRLRVHEDTARPVGEFFRELGVLLDFEITGGIPETLPRLLHVLQEHLPKRWQLSSALQ